MPNDAAHNPARRALVRVLLGTAWASLVAAAGLGLGALLRLAGADGGTAAPAPVVFARPPAPGGVITEDGVALARDGHGLYALNLVCPHLGCRPAWEPRRRRFLCPCHGSAFAPDGARLEGPAPRGLRHVALERVADGRLVAYPARPVDAGLRLEA